MSSQLDILALEPFYGGARRSMLETLVRCSRHRWTVLKLPPRRMERRLSAAAVWFAEQLSRYRGNPVDVLFTSEALNLASLLRRVPRLGGKPSVVYFHANQLPDPDGPDPVEPASAGAMGVTAGAIAGATRNSTRSEWRGGDGAPAATTPEVPEAAVAVVGTRPVRKSGVAGGNDDGTPVHLVNLNTATAASEIWFNSLFHLKDFLARATGLVARHPELANRNPMAPITAKSHLVSPPVDVGHVQACRARAAAADSAERDSSCLFVDTRDADVRLLNDALAILRDRGEQVSVVTVGPVKDLDGRISRRELGETDDAGQARAMFEVGSFVSVRPQAPCDFLAVRALAAGCPPVFPAGGVYAELLPRSMHRACLYEPTAESLAARLEDAISPLQPVWDTAKLRPTLKPFDPIAACRAIDERLERLAAKAGPSPVH